MAADLARLQAGAAAGAAARAKLRQRMRNLHGMAKKKADAEVDKIEKAMEALIKAEMRQAALEAA